MFMKKDTQIPALHAYRSTRSANLRQRSRAVDVAFGSMTLIKSSTRPLAPQFAPLADGLHIAPMRSDGILSQLDADATNDQARFGGEWQV